VKIMRAFAAATIVIGAIVMIVGAYLAVIAVLSSNLSWFTTLGVGIAISVAGWLTLLTLEIWGRVRAELRTEADDEFTAARMLGIFAEEEMKLREMLGDMDWGDDSDV